MTYIPEQDFYLNVNKGLVPGQAQVHKYGRNDSVANGSWEGVLLLSTTFTFLTAATTVRVKAGGDAADTSAGAGARTVTVEGLDDTGAEASETITLAGASASSATSASFWRVFRAYVATVGTYGVANTDVVTIENSAGGTDLISIGQEEGQSQYAAYAIPTGKTGYLQSLHATVDASKPADLRVFTRENLTDTSAPMSPARLRLYFDGLQGVFDYRPYGPEFSMSALTDIWVEAQGSGASTEVSVDFEIILVDN